MFNKELITYIRQSYEELKNLEVSIDNQRVKGNLYNLLTPFLAFTNSLDNQNRIISFYTREGSKQQKLLPFYIGISNYYKIYHDIKKDYSSSDFDTTTLEMKLNAVERMFPKEFPYLRKKWVFNGLKVNLERNNKIYFSIKSIEKRPLVRAPQLQDLLHNFNRIRGINISEITIAVDELQEYLNSFLVENKKFLEFNKINEGGLEEIDIKNIVKLGTKVNIRPSSVVLLFTNKTKYKQLIKDVKINNSPISKLIPVAEIKISRKGNFSIHQDDFEDINPIIYFCSSEYYMGWSVIIEEIGLNHVNTIVFDDFDYTLRKESRNDFLDFDSFTNELIDAQSKSIIKDVYFLQKDYSFELDKILKQFNIDSYPWLINHKERRSLNGKAGLTGPNFKVYPISSELSYIFWVNFKNLTRQLTDEINETYDIEFKAELLSVIKQGYQLLDRLNSFYSPEKLVLDYNSFIHKLKGLKYQLNSVSFNNKLRDLDIDLDRELFNSNKLNVIVELIQKNEIADDILIVSKNQNEFDKEFVRHFLIEKTNVSCSFIHIDDLEYDLTKHYKNAFYLSYSGKFTKSIFLTNFCSKQHIILNRKMEYGYFKYCFEQYGPIIEDLSNFDNKLLLLNLEDQEYLIDSNKISYDLKSYTDFNYLRLETETSTDLNSIDITDGDDKDLVLNDNQGNSEFDFSFVINNIIKSNKDSHTNTSKIKDNAESNYLIYFDDGFLRAYNSKYFYLLIDLENKNTHDIKKKASELKRGDKIFVMSGFNDDFNELLEFLRKKYTKLEKYIKKANSWRYDLKQKLIENGGYITHLQRYLESKGIGVSYPTVDRWVTGLTIYPEQLDKLVELFRHEEGSFTSKYSKQEVLDATDWIAKFRTKLHRQIYLYHIYKTYGMTHQINELELKRIIESLNEVVEVKEILMIEKE